MTILNGNLVLATAMTFVLAGCGGTEEPVPADGDATAAIDTTSEVVDNAATETGTAIDTTTQAVDNASTEAGDAMNQASDSATAAVESASDSVGEGWTELQANWQDSIGSIKDRWADLSEEELLSVNGDREALVTLVQDKYDLDRETAESEVNDWASTL